jgi:hypothetical protein
MASTHERLYMRQVFDVLYAQRAKVHYPPGDVRTESIHEVATLVELNQLLARPQGLTVDCSQLVQLVCHVGGIRSPSGSYAFDGATSTMLRGPCRQYSSPRHAGLMAIVVFLSVPAFGDAPGGHHTAFVIEPDPLHGNPLLGSHGSEEDPRKIKLRDELSAQRGRPYVFLSIIGL